MLSSIILTIATVNLLKPFSLISSPSSIFNYPNSILSFNFQRILMHINKFFRYSSPLPEISNNNTPLTILSLSYLRN